MPLFDITEWEIPGGRKSTDRWSRDKIAILFRLTILTDKFKTVEK